MKQAILFILTAGWLTVYGQNDNPVLPPCPDNLLPVVEIQINNTSSNHDDYASTATYTVCSARVINFANSLGESNFPGGVLVELRNPPGRFNLSFSATGGNEGSTVSMFATLPEDGSWFTFYVKGNNTDLVDKSTIIEMAIAGTCSDVVIARKALMIPSGAFPIPDTSQRPRVEIEVGSVSTFDDYLTWAPKLCRIRVLNDTLSTQITFQKPFKPTDFVVSHASFVEAANSYVTPDDSLLNITLQNMPGTNRLRFADNTLAAGHTATNSTLLLSLPCNGSWVYFFMAGNFNNASLNDKDAVVEIIDAGTGLLLSREGVMVRIRKNANLLTAVERGRFLEALKKVNLTNNDYIDFVKTHSRDNNEIAISEIASRQAHKGSALLPWHRAFILHLERLLQAADPSVAIPYWKFDANAKNVFNPNFMGSNNPDSTVNMAKLSATNPIVSWTLQGEGVPTGIQRKTPYGDKGHPKVATETATLGLGSPSFYFSSFKTMEASYHNPAHGLSGTASWIKNQNTSPRDPLFFLLHANVDRMWAKWQWMRNRYVITDTITYDLQGSFYAPAPGVLGPNTRANRTLGQYADDTMWPWDNVTGGTGPAARPNIAILKPLPVTLGTVLPGKPTIKSVIDYLGITITTPGSDLGFGYDDFFPY